MRRISTRRGVFGLFAGVAALGLAFAVAAQTRVAPASGDARLDTAAQTAWQRVRQALTPAQQANEARAFMAALATANGQRVVPAMDARDLASGRTVALDDPALLQRPQAHEVTVSVGGQFLTFRPLSRASLDALLWR